MADVKWIALATNMFDDEKIALIEAMPDADAIIVIWLKMLTLAGKLNNGGVLMMSNGLPYTDEMLSTLFHRPLNTVRKEALLRYAVSPIFLLVCRREVL